MICMKGMSAGGVVVGRNDDDESDDPNDDDELEFSMAVGILGLTVPLSTVGEAMSSPAFCWCFTTTVSDSTCIISKTFPHQLQETKKFSDQIDVIPGDSNFWDC